MATVYARTLGIALAEKTYDTHESRERAALNELLSSLDLEGVLIQVDALHTTKACFDDGVFVLQRCCSAPLWGGLITVLGAAGKGRGGK